MQRSRVDLPEPDLPSSATISPSRNSNEMSSSTDSDSPSGLVNALVTCSTVTMVNGATAARPSRGSVAVVIVGVSFRSARSQRVAGLGQVVEASPDQAVDADHVDAHDDDTGEDAWEVADTRGLGDVGAQPGGDEMVVAEVDDLGHDRRVPRATRGGDAAGDIGGEDARQDQPLPTLARGQAEVGGHLSEIVGDRHAPGDGVEQDVPLRPQRHEEDAAHVQAETEMDERDGGEREQQDGREAGED